MTREFIVLIEQGEDGYLIADVPELPGCHTQGKSEAELMANVREAIALFLEAKGDSSAHKVLRIERVAV